MGGVGVDDEGACELKPHAAAPPSLDEKHRGLALRIGVYEGEALRLEPCPPHLVNEVAGPVGAVAEYSIAAVLDETRRRGGEVWLMPENDNFAPIDGREAEIIGLVKAVVREY